MCHMCTKHLLGFSLVWWLFVFLARNIRDKHMKRQKTIFKTCPFGWCPLTLLDKINMPQIRFYMSPPENNSLRNTIDVSVLKL